MEDNENINDHIRKSLEGYRLEPKISSFDEIRKKMEKKKRRKFLFFIFPGFAALLVLGGLLIYNAYTPVSPSAEFVSQRLKNHSSKQKDLIHVKKVEDPGTPQTKILPDKKSTEPDKPEQEIKTPKPAMALLPNDSKPAISGNSDSQEHTADVSPVENYIPEEADRLDLKFLFLPEIETAPELISDEQNISDLVVKDSVKKEKPLQFFIGGAFSPQANRYQFLENKNGVGSEGPFAGNYLNTKKDKNAIRFSYGFGLRVGLSIKNSWEIIAGFGFQRYSQEEKMYLAPVSTSTIPSLSGIPSFKADQSLPGISKDGSYKSIYKYWDYSLDVNRLFTANKVFKIKVGIGIKAQQLRYWSNKLVAITADGDGNYYYRGGYSPSLNKWLTTIQVKAGLIEDLNKTVQLQLCPLVYYSLNSMYKRDYLIKQKNYGVGLECLLLFKIR